MIVEHTFDRKAKMIYTLPEVVKQLPRNAEGVPVVYSEGAGLTTTKEHQT